MSKSFFIRLLASGMTLVLFTSGARADNWGHWRGEAGNGVSTTAKPPTEWSTTKNVKWKVAIPGLGSGSPVIWGDQVFVVTAVSTDGSSKANSVTKLEFKLMSFDRKNGDLQWERTATQSTPHQATHNTNGFASASPCTDGQHVYANFGSRGIYCYTMDGDLKWKRDDLGEMETRNDFGEGSSATIEGDMLIVPWDHEGFSYLLAVTSSRARRFGRPRATSRLVGPRHLLLSMLARNRSS